MEPEIFLRENNCNSNFYKLNYKLVIILFLSLLTKQESSFQQVGGMVTRNISTFCL